MIDAEHNIVPGSRDVADVLETDPLFSLLHASLARPALLGAVVFGLILLMLIFGPSSESRFIYTDF
jgi:hypothetical protein